MESSTKPTTYGSIPSSSNTTSRTSTVSPPSWTWTIIASVLMGILFGLAFYKSHVYEPQMIRGQFLFQKFVMLKVFFGAMGTGAIGLAILSMAKIPQFASARNLWRPTATTRGWLTGPALGGFLLGAGMAISGACPGMVLAAFGAQCPDSGWTILGGLCGALLYGLNAGRIQRCILDKGPKGPASKSVYADEELGIPYYFLAMGLGMVCLLGCVVLETLIPWKSEVPGRFQEVMASPVCAADSFDFWNCPAWPPSLAGCLVGSLQLGTVLVIQTFLGSATAFQVGASCWMMPLSTDYRSTKFPYLHQFATPNPKAWWQLWYVGTAVVIAYGCAQHHDDLGRATGGVGVPSAFFGGLLLLWASRLGGGCTSGHGLSGCAILLLQSWIAVPAMFAGGIAVAVLWQYGVGGFFVPS